MAGQVAAEQDGLPAEIVQGDQHLFVGVVIVRRRGRVHVGVHARRQGAIGGAVAVAEAQFVTVAAKPIRGQITDHEGGRGPSTNAVVR